MKHPECKNVCAYARDIGMAPQYTCVSECQYAKASLQALKKSPLMRDAADREADRDMQREAVEAYETDRWLDHVRGKD